MSERSAPTIRVVPSEAFCAESGTGALAIQGDAAVQAGRP